MSELNRILIADSDQATLSLLQRCIAKSHYEAVSTVDSAEQLIKACHRFKPDLLIADWRMPFERIDQIPAIAVVALCPAEDAELANLLKRSMIAGYLFKPLRVDEVAFAVSAAMERFRELNTLRSQVVELQIAIQDRKLVEKAKGFIMEKLKLSEADAHRYLQSQAREQRKKLAEVAECIVVAASILSPANSSKTMRALPSKLKAVPSIGEASIYASE